MLADAIGEFAFSYADFAVFGVACAADAEDPVVFGLPDVLAVAAVGDLASTVTVSGAFAAIVVLGAVAVAEVALDAARLGVNMQQ